MVDRRTFLTAAGLVSVGSMAGCLGDEDEDIPDVETTDGPAEFAVYGASVSDDESVTVDSDTTIDIVIGNRGGEPGEPDVEAVIDSLESESAPQRSASLSTVEEEVESGGTVTLTTETVDFEYAGRYAVTASDASDGLLPVDDDADAEIEVGPIRAEAGGTQEVVEDLRFTVEDVSFEQGLHYDITESTGGLFGGSRDRVAVESTLSDQTLVFVNVSVENAGSSGLTVGTENFTFADESALTSLSGTAFGDLRDIESSPIEGVSVNPGSRINGWILFRANKNEVSDAEIGYHRDSRSAPKDAIWELDIGDVGFPEFEFVSMDVPDQREEGFQEFEFTIANVGDAVGTFRGELEWREGDSADWERRLEGNETLSARIPAGEEATITQGSENDELDSTYDYRLNPFGATFTIGPSE